MTRFVLSGLALSAMICAFAAFLAGYFLAGKVLFYLGAALGLADAFFAIRQMGKVNIDLFKRWRKGRIDKDTPEK